MLAVFENPAVRERAAAITLERYHRIFSAEDRAPYELIRGAIIEKMPQSALHASIIGVLRAHAEMRLASGYHIREEKPLTFTDSEPEPDLAIVQGDHLQFIQEHPHTAAIVLEVAISSEGLDRLKAELYAEAGVAEYWLVLPNDKAIERHTEPQGSAYRVVERTTFDGSLPSTVLPGLSYPPPALSRIV